MTSSPADGTPDSAGPLRAELRRLAPLQIRDASRYERIGEHGRGGLGRVLRAHDKELGRDVAIKELLDRGLGSELRFYREALITARLEHPGIVPVHEAGRWADGTPFYAMKLVAGRPLKQEIEGADGPADRLALLGNVIAVADAIAYAHEHRIIHRDLKPANVIVGEFGETVVIDWGLAKRLDDPDVDALEPPVSTSAPSDLTAAGTVLGTPAYMAPEQQRGRADERSDIYALGGILYHVLTGAAPHESGAGLGLHAGVPRDLQAIASRALASDPAERYTSARAFADDLRRYQRRAPVTARRYSLAARIALGVARYRALAIAFVAALVVLAIVLAIAVSKIAGERAEAVRARHIAEEAQRTTERTKDELVLQNAELLLHRDPTAVVAALAGYRGDEPIRRDLLRAEAAGRGVAQRVVDAHRAESWFVAPDPHGAIVSVSADGTVRSTDGTSTTVLASDAASSGVVGAVAAPHLVAYARAPDGIAVLDLASHRMTAIATDAPARIAVSPDETRIAELSPAGRLRVWQLAPAAPPARVFEAEVVRGVEIVFVGNARVLVMDDRAIHAIDLAIANTGPTAPAFAASFSSETMPMVFDADARGERVVLVDAGTLTLLTRDLVALARLAACRLGVAAASFVPGSDAIVYGCREGVVGIARLDGGRLVTADSFTTGAAVLSVRVGGDGRSLVASDESNTLFAYDLVDRIVARRIGHSARINYIAPASAALPLMISSDRHGSYRLWSPPDHAARLLYRTKRALNRDAAFAPDGSEVLVLDADGGGHLLALSGAATIDLLGHTAPVVGPVFSPGGDRIITPSQDGTVRIWRRDGTELAAFRGHRGVVAAAQPIDAERIASAGDDGRLLLWRPGDRDGTVLFQAPAPLTTLDRIGNGPLLVSDARGALTEVALDGASRALRAPGPVITVLRVARDGRHVAIGLDDGAVIVYETARWTEVASARTSRSISQVQFDPKGDTLAFASLDGRVRVLGFGGRSRLGWDAVPVLARDLQFSQDGSALVIAAEGGGIWIDDLVHHSWRYIVDHERSANGIALSPDGHWLVSTDPQGSVVLRDLRTTP